MFSLVTSLLIVSPRIGGGDQYGSKDACTIYKSSWVGKKLSSREDHIKKIIEMLDDIWLYHVERNMILNDNECPRHDLR